MYYADAQAKHNFSTNNPYPSQGVFPFSQPIDDSIPDPLQPRPQARIDTLLAGERFMDIRAILHFEFLASPRLDSPSFVSSMFPNNHPRPRCRPPTHFAFSSPLRNRLVRFTRCCRARQLSLDRDGSRTMARLRLPDEGFCIELRRRRKSAQPRQPALRESCRRPCNTLN